nr:hypothetical protein CFP56_39179 [Quercus suber]
MASRGNWCSRNFWPPPVPSGPDTDSEECASETEGFAEYESGFCVNFGKFGGRDYEMVRKGECSWCSLRKMTDTSVQSEPDKS